MKIFNKILIANRGEIAVRIIKAAHDLGIKTVAIFSDPDQNALHVKMADEAYHIGSKELHDSYLNIDKIIEVALKSKADAIHPGYGFLSENPKLIEACLQNGIVFIGPHVQAIKLMGNKVESRAFVANLKVPMTKGVTGNIETLKKEARNIPLPLLVKAAAGGGGKGMRLVKTLDELDETIESTSREALAYFGNAEVFIEQFIENPRHIEIQVLGDKQGNVIHLFERECSLQRRYQKIIEESPSPTLNQETRLKMGASAVAISKAIGYDSVGTIEFLVDPNLNYYFLEMNTRIQVEHPVTEMVTSVDLVKEQILVAAGNPLRFTQDQIVQKGHAIEARVYAEEPEFDFRPSPGEITFLKQPTEKSIRIDTALVEPATIHSFFDPMISKVIAYAPSREMAIEKLIHALNHYIIHGIGTNISYLIELLNSSYFINNQISTKFCDLQIEAFKQNIINRKQSLKPEELALAYLMYHLESTRLKPNSIWNQMGYWRVNPAIEVFSNENKYHFRCIENNGHSTTWNFENQTFDCKILDINPNFIRIEINKLCRKIYLSEAGQHTWLSFGGHIFQMKRNDLLYPTDFYNTEEQGEAGDKIFSPMPGKLIKIQVNQGDIVKKGQKIAVVEAMKMENQVTAPRDGIIDEIKVNIGQMLDGSQVLVTLVEEE